MKKPPKGAMNDANKPNHTACTWNGTYSTFVIAVCAYYFLREKEREKESVNLDIEKERKGEQVEFFFNGTYNVAQYGAHGVGEIEISRHEQRIAHAREFADIHTVILEVSMGDS